MTWDPYVRRIIPVVLDKADVAERGVHVGETRDTRSMLEARDDTLLLMADGCRENVDSIKVYRWRQLSPNVQAEFRSALKYSMQRTRGVSDRQKVHSDSLKGGRGT